MRKTIGAILFVCFSIVIVSAFSKTTYHGKLDRGPTVLADCKKSVDLVYLDDSFVPEVQGVVLNHVESVVVLADGYKPAKEAKARAPTIDIRNRT